MMYSVYLNFSHYSDNIKIIVYLANITKWTCQNFSYLLNCSFTFMNEKVQDFKIFHKPTLL